MGFFETIGEVFGSGSSKDENIDGFMAEVETADADLLHEPASMYVKPLSIDSEAGLNIIEAELSKNNMLLVDITELNKRPNTRSKVIGALKGYVSKKGGDIGQIDATRILITPAKVRIVKRARSRS